MSRTRPLRLLIGSAVAGGAALVWAHTGAAATYAETATSLTLSNATARYTFSTPFRGSITELEDRRVSLDLMAGLPYPAPLFELRLASGCGSSPLTNLSAGTFRWYGWSSAGVASLRLEWTGLGGHDLDVTAWITLSDASPRALWRLAVDNRDTDVVLRTAAFPFLSVRSTIGADGSDDTLVLPLLDGVLVHDPTAAMAPGEGLSGLYPAGLSLQMGMFADRRSGLYAAVRDRTGAPKTVAFTRADIDGTPALVVQVATAVPETAGGGFAPAWDVELGPFSGDWFDAASLYRIWAAAGPTFPPPLAGRTDLPPALAAPRPVVTSACWADDGSPVLPASDWPDRAAEFSSFLGRPLTLLTFGWERLGAWTSPGVFPPRDGEQAFRSATAALEAGGSGAFVYLSGSVWRLGRSTLPSYDDTARFEAVGRPWAAVTCAGEPLHDAFYESIGWPSVRMCPAASGWTDTVVEEVVEAVRLGADTVSVDEFPVGSVYACHSAEHGHPPGSGPWQAAAWRALLATARAEGRAVRPGLALTAEEPNELYADLLDAYASRDNMPEGMYADLLRRWGDRVETVPLFAAVYHDRLPALAEAPTIYDALGLIAELRPWLALTLGRSLVLGKVPAAAIVPLAATDPALRELFRRTAAAAAGDLRPWTFTGRLLRPPILTGEPIVYTWTDTDPATGAFVLRQRSAPAVQAGRFQAADGRLATVLVNVTAQARTASVPVDTGGLPPPFRLYGWSDGAWSLLADTPSPPATVAVELPPYAVAAVVVERYGPRPIRHRLQRPRR